MKKTLFLFAVLTFALSGCSAANLSSKFFKDGAKILTQDEAKTAAEKFINENLMSEGSVATIKEAGKDGDLYKLTVSLPSGQEITSYMTRDGKKFFPQMMDIKEKEAAAAEEEPQAKDEEATAATVKKDKPEVELFVMSHCPYGTQIEKGMLPVVEALGSKIDFKLKFVDYAMHGEKELKEELRQYCIQKNEPAKLLSYLKCFLKEGNDQTCVKEAKIITSKLNSCVNATDKEFSITKNFNDK